jgi:ribosomal-protein-alanine N-acetyltransferase
MSESKIPSHKSNFQLPTLNSARLILRPLHLSDAPAILENAQNPHINQFLNVLPTVETPPTLEHAQQLIKQLQQKTRNFKKLPFAISLGEKQHLIGIISLHTINQNSQRAQVGFWLNQKYWRQGYTTEALQAILQYAFHSLDFNRLESHVQPDNLASNQLFKSAGFQKEGTLHQWRKHNGKWIDINIYGLLKSQFQPRQ